MPFLEFQEFPLFQYAQETRHNIGFDNVASRPSVHRGTDAREKGAVTRLDCLERALGKCHQLKLVYESVRGSAVLSNTPGCMPTCIEARFPPLSRVPVYVPP